MPRPRPAVFVDGLHKEFELPRERVHTLKERVLHPLRGQAHDRLHALEDVSFAVDHGEFFGIVGRNGSGKSTLLKCMASIYAADRGRIFVDGRISAFIELGVGFNPDLPARDNIMLNGTMAGLTPREARKRIDAVLDFAELRDFVDLRLKNYSSGMLVRLAFAVMVQIEADVMLVDEVLAVGDASFQQKCFDAFARLRKEGRTVLLVTHDMGAVKRFCDRAILLEQGHLVAEGDPEAVGTKYLDLNFSAQAREAEQAAAGSTSAAVLAPSEGERRAGDGAAEIVHAWFEEQTGVETTIMHTDRQWAFVAQTRFHQRVTDPDFSLTIHNQHGDILFRASTAFRERGQSVTYEAGDTAWLRVFLHNVFGPDRYYASATVAHSSGAWIDHRERMLSFVVTGTLDTGGLVQLPHDMDVTREPAPVLPVVEHAGP